MRFASVSLFALFLAVFGLVSCRSDSVPATSLAPLPAQVEPVVGERSSAPLMLGTFPARDGASRQASAADRLAHIETFRHPFERVSDARVSPPALRPQLARIAEALEQDDTALALALSDAATRAFPSSVEPLEMALLVHLRAEDAKLVTQTIDRIGKIDESNAFVPALAGLRAMREGDFATALGWLGWFIGEDPLARRGVIAPLLTARGELEEQAAIAAMSLGYMQAALDALDAAIAVQSTDPARVRMLTLLRADALVGLGRDDDALSTLAALEAELCVAFDARTSIISINSMNATASLAALRADELRARIDAQDDSLARAIDAIIAVPSDEIRLWRVTMLAQNAGQSARMRAVIRLDAARSQLNPRRHALMAAALDPSHRTQVLDDAWLDVSDVGEPVDRVALQLSMRHFARFSRDRLMAVACVVAGWRPNELDAVALALLASGVEVDGLRAELVARGDSAAAYALRSRIAGRFGFPEEAQAIAQEGRTRMPTSKVLRAAAAFAAVDLLDATLLEEVDSASRADEGSIDRTLALGWYALQEMPIARARATTALQFDARDRAAQVCASLASLEDPALRNTAAERVYQLAGASDSIAAEAWSMRDEIRSAVPDFAPAQSAWPVCANALVGLRLLAAECEALRLPLGGECLALAEEVDPSQRSLEQLLRIASARQAPPKFRAWCERVRDEAPALPSRRRLCTMRSSDVGALIPEEPLCARFDAISAAPREVVLRDRDARMKLRPATPSADSLRALTAIESGELDKGFTMIESMLNAGASAPLATIAGRRMLAGMRRIVEADPARAPAMQPLLAALIARMQRLSPSDLLEANRIHLAIDQGPSATESFERLLAQRARPMLCAEVDACIEVLRAMVGRADDSFAAAMLAEALCVQVRIAPEVRASLAIAAIALRIGSGADVEEVAALAQRLCDAGAAPWSQAGAWSQAALGRKPVAHALMRTAEIYTLLGQRDSSDRLLLAALELEPLDPELLNSIAYAQIDRGEILESTIVAAERAAEARPDDPAVLDTVGFLRYHQGRFRDDASGLGAISIYRQALRVRPNSPSIVTLDHLGDALWRAGDQEGAIKSWQQVGVVARRRYPPKMFAERMSAFQLRTYGFELVPIAQFVRREFGAVVERAQGKLEEVAAGKPPGVVPCKGTR